MSDGDCLYLSPYGLVKGMRPATGGMYLGPADAGFDGDPAAPARLSLPDGPVSTPGGAGAAELELVALLAGHESPAPASAPMPRPVAPPPAVAPPAMAARQDILRNVPAVRPPRADDIAPGRLRGHRSQRWAVSAISCLLVAGIGWHFTSVPRACALPQAGADPAVQMAAASVAGHIVTAESGGDSSAKNPRSTATGAGQFLAGTWLDMIRAYRPDLNGRSEADLLDLRRDAALARQMVARFAEANAAMLGSRCLPVTPGTLYLAHFAGGGGAVAVLSAPEHADAATTMAQGDASGRTTRDMIVTANPFLERFTVADLKSWADRKMRAAGRRISRM